MVALSEMSRGALRKELRVAQAFPCGNFKQINRIKYWLAKRKPRAKVEVKFEMAVKPRAYVDD